MNESGGRLSWLYNQPSPTHIITYKQFSLEQKSLLSAKYPFLTPHQIKKKITELWSKVPKQLRKSNRPCTKNRKLIASRVKELRSPGRFPKTPVLASNLPDTPARRKLLASEDNNAAVDYSKLDSSTPIKPRDASGDCHSRSIRVAQLFDRAMPTNEQNTCWQSPELSFSQDTTEKNYKEKWRCPSNFYKTPEIIEDVPVLSQSSILKRENEDNKKKARVSFHEADEEEGDSDDDKDFQLAQLYVEENGCSAKDKSNSINIKLSKEDGKMKKKRCNEDSAPGWSPYDFGDVEDMKDEEDADQVATESKQNAIETNGYNRINSRKKTNKRENPVHILTQDLKVVLNNVSLKADSDFKRNELLHANSSRDAEFEVEETGRRIPNCYFVPINTLASEQLPHSDLTTPNMPDVVVEAHVKEVSRAPKKHQRTKTAEEREQLIDETLTDFRKNGDDFFNEEEIQGSPCIKLEVQKKERQTSRKMLTRSRPKMHGKQMIGDEDSMTKNGSSKRGIKKEAINNEYFKSSQNLLKLSENVPSVCPYDYEAEFGILDEITGNCEDNHYSHNRFIKTENSNSEHPQKDQMDFGSAVENTSLLEKRLSASSSKGFVKELKMKDASRKPEKEEGEENSLSASQSKALTDALNSLKSVFSQESIPVLDFEEDDVVSDASAVSHISSFSDISEIYPDGSDLLMLDAKSCKLPFPDIDDELPVHGDQGSEELEQNDLRNNQKQILKKNAECKKIIQAKFGGAQKMAVNDFIDSAETLSVMTQNGIPVDCLQRNSWDTFEDKFGPYKSPRALPTSGQPKPTTRPRNHRRVPTPNMFEELPGENCGRMKLRPREGKVQRQGDIGQYVVKGKKVFPKREKPSVATPEQQEIAQLIEDSTPTSGTTSLDHSSDDSCVRFSPDVDITIPVHNSYSKKKNAILGIKDEPSFSQVVGLDAQKETSAPHSAQRKRKRSQQGRDVEGHIANPGVEKKIYKRRTTQLDFVEDNKTEVVTQKRCKSLDMNTSLDLDNLSTSKIQQTKLSKWFTSEPEGSGKSEDHVGKSSAGENQLGTQSTLPHGRQAQKIRAPSRPTPYQGIAAPGLSMPTKTHPEPASCNYLTDAIVDMFDEMTPPESQKKSSRRVVASGNRSRNALLAEIFQDGNADVFC